MAFKISLNCKIYDDCDKLMLYNYEQYLKTQDNIWFSNFNELDLVKKPSQKELQEAFYNFFGDMLRITENPRVLDRFESIHKILKYKTKYNSVMVILNCIYNFNTDLDRQILLDHITNLEKWNYRIDKNKDLFEQLDKINHRVQGYLSEIDLLEKKIKDKDTETEINLNKELIQVATFIDLRFPIDKKTTSVAQWLEYCAIAKEKSDNLNKDKK